MHCQVRRPAGLITSCTDTADCNNFALLCMGSTQVASQDLMCVCNQLWCILGQHVIRIKALIVHRKMAHIQGSAVYMVPTASTGFPGEFSNPHCDDNNRMGIDGTLHRIIAIRDRSASRNVTSLTYRIGRHVPGQLTMIALCMGSAYCSCAPSWPIRLGFI